MPTPRALRRTISALIGASLIGCTSPDAADPEPVTAASSETDVDRPPTGRDPLAGVPEDLTIDVAVVSAGYVPSVEGSVALRPQRAIVFPDGSYHHDLGRGPTARNSAWRPPLRRRLDARELADLWARIDRLGLASAADVGDARNLASVRATPGRVTWLVEVRADGVIWTLERSGPAEGPPDPAMADLVGALAELAWVDDRPGTEVTIPAPRDDYGADPYAIYRRPAAPAGGAAP